jgi:tetratricopeptide (TPR) repeat protein
VFRQLSVFPGPFTLEAAEAVAGPGAGPAVLHLVDCSLLAPPQIGPDGHDRYLMLETLRACGSRLLTEACEHDGTAAALAGYALGVAEEAAAGLQTSTREVAAARRLDAEEATLRQALAWAMDHDPAVALRLAVALAPWWLLRGRLADGFPLLRAAADRAAVGSETWCTAQFWLGLASHHSADLVEALGHYTAIRDAIRDRPPSWALADCLSGRSRILANMGRTAEAVDGGRRSLAVAQELGYPAGEALALFDLAFAADFVGDLEAAVQLARRAEQIPADIPGHIARLCSGFLTHVLTASGDLAAADCICAAGLVQARDAGDLENQARLLTKMAILDVQEGRIRDATSPRSSRDSTRLAHKRLSTGPRRCRTCPSTCRRSTPTSTPGTGHKALGPTGIGALHGCRELLEGMASFLARGDMISSVGLQTSTWNALPWKSEAGTSMIAEAVGLSAAIDYLGSLAISRVRGA